MVFGDHMNTKFKIVRHIVLWFRWEVIYLELQEHALQPGRGSGRGFLGGALEWFVVRLNGKFLAIHILVEPVVSS